jgi:hypothetical protein
LAYGISLTVQIAISPYVDIATNQGEVIVAEAAEMQPEIASAQTPLEVLPVTGPEVEEYVRTYFADVPVLAEIARCESTFRHHDSRTGSILKGKVNNNDVGVMQINTVYHRDTARRLGYDLETIEGNLGYARNLYEREGTRPWNSSRACWNKEHLAMR